MQIIKNNLKWKHVSTVIFHPTKHIPNSIQFDRCQPSSTVFEQHQYHGNVVTNIINTDYFQAGRFDLKTKKIFKEIHLVHMDVVNLQ